MKNQRGFTFYEIFVLLMAVVIMVGWVWNIVKISDSDFSSLTAMLVLRCIGIIVAPLGAVLGYL